MNFSDQRKEFFNGYNLTVLLDFSSRKNDNAYNQSLKVSDTSQKSIIAIFLAAHIFAIFYIVPASVFHIPSLVLFYWFFKTGVSSRYRDFIPVISIFASPLNLQANQLSLLLLEFAFHLRFLQKFKFYFIALFLRLFIYQNLSVFFWESIFCVFCFGLLTKDLKYFWAMKSIYSDMTEDIKQSSQGINSGYFLLDLNGKIIEKDYACKTLEEILEKPNVSHLTELFSEDHCDICFSMLKKAKKGIESEQEILFIKKTPEKIEKFTSLSIRVIPMSIQSKNLFLFIFKDISSQISERNQLFELAKEKQKNFKTLEQKFLKLFLMQKPVEEKDLNSLRIYFFQQFETRSIISILLGSSDLNLNDFDVKTEVTNTIQMIWGSLSSQETKINLFTEKELPPVRSDKFKHNLLLKLMIEFIYYYIEKSSNLLISLTRSSLFTVQYKFKFSTTKLSEKTLNSLFSQIRLKNKTISTEKSKLKQIIYICSHLIRILNGQIEENKINSELKVCKISYSLSFNKGTLDKSKVLKFLNYPEDAFVISWPLSLIPKRTNLSINKLRKIVNSKPSKSQLCISSTSSNEILEIKLPKKQVFVSEKLSKKFIEKVSKVANVVIGDFFFAIFMNFPRFS